MPAQAYHTSKGVCRTCDALGTIWYRHTKLSQEIWSSCFTNYGQMLYITLPGLTNSVVEQST